ncbi:bifunctional aspartate kinase/homoserine dehydrogenase I [uncultured Rikenella sp.]|uniref:bifunctional aspartate kinase/homoserine dehydrogenase I n=1 Tax=uncultured Rikenella sp. TaxID=368003 RepID=UPI0025F9A686|nr:bifunctional aspartate kinase/homoserine dehydrogenase I [uncultured Rikenella sp.]
MKVFKFGGTSVGSAAGLQNIREIIGREPGRVAVVVSALGGITDLLLATGAAAAQADPTYRDQYETICRRHREAIAESVPTHLQAETSTQVEALLEELGNILRGIFLIQDLSPKTTNTVVGYGERLSSLIVSRIIDGAVLRDARAFIKTEPYFNKHIVDFTLTNELVRSTFADDARVSVVPGFISSDKTTGEATTLGRGGSDYTAAIIAAAVGAEALNIYTDVDGFMTADPRVIDKAYLIESLTFVEAMELCNFGAKVIYPPTIFPAYNRNIPIYIRNTYRTECPGTYISREVTVPVAGRGDIHKAIKGISSINDSCLLTIRGLGMCGVIGVNYRIFKALAKAGVSVFMVSQASSENTTSIGVRRDDAERAREVLSTEFAQEIATGEIDEIMLECDLATVAIVGENMRHCPGIAGKLFGTLGRNGINVIACAQGASETNISFVVKVESLRKTLNVIHDSFFLSEYQVLNLFLTGVGLVGGSLIEQIRSQQEELLRTNALKINVVGISNSRRSIFDREGIDLSQYRERLETEGIPTTPQTIRDRIAEMNIFNSVFVDCTASPEVAEIYGDLLGHNVSVVTANKIAASSAYDHYAALKNTARTRGVKFLFETNVGAGLPIINTINDLRHSGDTILGLRAVLSGTLNYIFNVLSEEVPFSRAVAMAKEAGYAEPDPRIDLSGTDVVRKLVILARESGYAVEQADVVKNLFVPASIFEGSTEDFWAKVPQLDEEFERQRRVLAAEGKRWRFVASMENGRCSVGLETVEAGHPFYDLEGSNNIILIRTTRYDEYPLQIKGYGAGASVTAAGVFADIMSIANIR